MGETDDFNTLVFEKKLTQLKDTQESIQSMSSWCLQQRIHHKKIVASWLNVLKRVKVEQRLVLFYLANDVIQYSKRKNYEFVDSWGLNLQKATPLVRDEKVRPKILRIFKIWEQRLVYDEEFLSDLTGLLSAGAIKKSDEDSSSDFQPQQLVNKIKQCTVLEADTDLRLKYIHESHLQLSDADALCANLKDRSHKDDVEKELNEGIACVERYTQALQREIVAREALLALLSSASDYYLTQMGEVKVVAYAYKTFGTRVRALKRKLDDLIPTLPNAAPSPPQRDEDVPSPGPDEDLDLPAPESADDEDLTYNIDQTFNTTLGADGSLYNMGLSSFLSSDNPMAIFNDSIDNNINSANKIEVISTRPNEKPDFNINDFLKNLIPAENNSTAMDTISVASGSLSQKSQDTLPGLDLLTPESTGNPPPPTSFYGSINSITEDLDQPYHPETSAPWTNNTWNVAPNAVGVGVGVGVGAVFAEPPESPPRQPLPPPPETPIFPQELPPVSDVDHRGILPPPPPPPVLPLLGNLEDVDHRLLAVPPPLVSTPTSRHSVMHQDVDHRNLISLTQAPRAPVPRPMNPIKLDQDYRVPSLVMPTDIVESVDMDLSEDEDQQGLYQNQQLQSEHPRRHSFNNNNNKVLVGGDNGKTNHLDHNHTNLIPINKIVEKEPQSAPILPPMVNPFDVMPPILKNINDPGQSQFPPPSFPNREFKVPEEIPKDNAFEENMRVANIDSMNRIDNVLPAMGEYEDFSNNSEWQNQSPRPFMNQRFPRTWAPRTNFRGQGFGPRQFWPRNAPRPPPNRWMAPRPQRFW